MSPVTSFLTLRHDGKWPARFVIGLVLFGPFYLAPSLVRFLLGGWGWWWYGFGILLSDALGSFVVGFLANNYRFGIGLCLGATIFELLLLYAGYEPRVALWMSDFIPALVGVYFAQQLYINMGD